MKMAVKIFLLCRLIDFRASINLMNRTWGVRLLEVGQNGGQNFFIT
jgi:hypothetical protein